jgi:aspartate aminotransferase-like enzyme
MSGRLDPAHCPPASASPAAPACGPAGATGQPERLARALRALGPLVGSAGPVLLFPGDAALLREIALRCGVAHRALALVTGAGGEAMARAAEALGKEVIRLAVPPGQAVEPEHLARFLQSPRVDAVLAVHAEPETGALLPLESLAAVVRGRKDVLLLVDATESLANEPLEADRWGLDFVVAPADRGLGGPRGLAVATASARFLAEARECPARGLALDPVRLFEADSAGSLAASLDDGPLGALDAVLDRLAAEPLPARFERIRRLRAMVDTWAERGHGWRVLARRGRRAAGLSVLMVPPGVEPGAVCERFGARGWSVGAGLGAHARATIRLTHAGQTTEAELGRLLESLEQVGEAGRLP